MTTATATRPRLSDAFLRDNHRKRIIEGTAKAISDRGYRRSTVAQIVAASHCARNTFYEVFGGKRDAALALAFDVCPDLEIGDRESLAVLAFETAADLKVDQARHLTFQMGTLGELDSLGLGGLDDIYANRGEDPYQRSFPPGRHGLSPGFVMENQRRRLLFGLADAVAERGYPATTSHVCAHASVSRRTFYEHFSSVEDLATSMLWEAAMCRFVMSSGMGAVAVEIVANRIVGNETSLAAEATAMLERFRDGGAG